MSNPLLDAAIKKFKIPRWPYEASFDRIVVFSVPEDAASRDTYVPGGLIAKPQNRKAADEAETPRGIIVSAGLAAQDVMRAHGISIGNMVWVARLSPWRHVVDKTDDGKDIEFLFLRVGDIVGSEDLQANIAKGHVSVELKEDGKHVYHFAKESARPRFDPPSYVA